MRNKCHPQRELMSRLTLTDLYSGSLDKKIITYSVSTSAVSYFGVFHHFRYGLCPESLCLFVLLSVALNSTLSPPVDWCFSLSLICCWLWLCPLFFFFTFFPSSFVFWLGLLSGALWGNAWSLSLSLFVHHYPCARLPVCVLCIPCCPSQPEFLHTSAAAFLSVLNVLIKCHILLFCYSYHHRHIKDAGIYSVCVM